MTGHEVELDLEAELAELERAAGEAEAVELDVERQAAAATSDPGAWRKAGETAASMFAGIVVPNWGLDASDQAQIAEAVAGVLDHYFPGAISGADNWHPLAQLAFVLGGVTVTRGVDWDRGGRLKPFRKPRKKDDGKSEAPGRLAPVPDGGDAERENGGGFSLGGSG